MNTSRPARRLLPSPFALAPARAAKPRIGSTGRVVAAVPLLLAALLLAPGAVWAQSGTLISNLGQSASSWHDIPGNCLAAQRFTTGSFADGYLITSVDVVSYDAEGDVFDVEVRPLGSDGRPSSTTLFTLTNPSSFAAGTLNFRSAGNTNVLQPDTSYAVLINSRSRDVSVGTTLGNEDAGGATGWSIADELSAQAQVGWTGPGIAGLALRIAVNGRENTGSGEPHLLTARFEDVPASHNGSDRFTFNVAFSHDITITRAENLQAHFRNHALDVTYGTVKRARRVDGRSDLWKITIEPDFETHQLGFYDDVTIVLPANRSCDAIGGICTADGKKLSNRVEAIVPMESRDDILPALSVADAEATEGEDNALDFVVTLDPAADGQVTVDYATADGTATAGADYTDTSGTLTFDAGETTKTVAVPIAEDTEEEGGETVTLTLSNASGATLAAASATGTIRNAGVANTPATGAPAISGTAQVDKTLTASVSDISDADGLDNASYAYRWIRGSSDIQGATGSSYTLVSADEGERIRVRVSFTDDAGNTESRTSAATDPVAAPPEPLTADFSGVPAEHTGEKFTFGLTFSDEPDVGFRALRDDALEASGGTVRRAKRQQSGSNLSWTIHVKPDGDGTVTVRLPAGAVETDDGRALSNSPSATVAGPVGISVADARVEEDAGAVLAFTVALSRAASSTLTVDYATSDGSAQAGVDYTAASGTLTFQSGESSKTIEVGVLDDAHDEGEETLTLTLSNASSGRITNANATGTIENRDPLPRALLARFGRTAAVHVVEHIEERLQAPREPGFEGRFAGRQLRRGMEREMALDFLRPLGGGAGMHPAGMNAAAMGTHGPMAGAAGGGMGAMPSLGTPGLGGGVFGMAAGGAMGHGAMGPMAGASGAGGGPFGGGLLSMGFGGGDLLTGSDFALNRESRGGILSFWSRGARSHFSGREGTLGLNGDVRTTMLGADYARGPLVAGLSLSHSRGLGEYAGVAAGQVLSSVTGLYPWLGYKVTDRVTVWGVGGYGAGGMLLTPDSGPALESGLSMAMAAAGTRGELLAGGASGFELAFKADALWVGTAVDGVDGPAGRLKATDAAVTRFRTGLEGSRAYTVGGRLSLTPSVELGLRHDGGDAETGAGMDVGVGLIVSDASTGLSVDVRVRTLLVHQDENFSERGVALSLSYNPTPSTPMGFTAKVAPSWGGQATSGAEALWGRETMAGMAQGGVAQGSRFDGEVGYGLPVGNRFVGTPRVGFSTSEYGRDYRVGYGLGVLDGESLNFELGVDAQRRESPLLGGADNGVLARASLGW